MALTDHWQPDGRRWALAGTVAAGSSEIIELPRQGESSIAVVPGGGGSALVEYTIAPLDAVADAAATWFPWPAGSVTAATEDGRLTPTTAFRVTATTADCWVEVLQ